MICFKSQMVKFYYVLKFLIISKHKNYLGKAVIRHVETDYSLPLLGAACQTFNEMSMKLYRKVCYEALTNKGN